jgi:hypothetical protein
LSQSSDESKNDETVEANQAENPLALTSLNTTSSTVNPFKTPLEPKLKSVFSNKDNAGTMVVSEQPKPVSVFIPPTKKR